VTKIISLSNMNLVTPKAGAKYEILFYKPGSCLLNKSSYLAPASGVTKFTIARVMILVTLCCATYDLEVEQTHLRLLKKVCVQLQL
jgi:hypothetical protein